MEAAAAPPHIHVSSIVAAELRAVARSPRARRALAARSPRDRRAIEERLLGPFARQERILTPSPAAWDALGRTLATLREREGLPRAQASRGFSFDVLLAFSCRENGAVLVSANAKDMARIRRVFAFDFVAPYPVTP